MVNAVHLNFCLTITAAALNIINMSDEVSEVEGLTTCQNCGANDPNLLNVDSGLKLSLSKSGMTEVPSNVCAKCLKELKKAASQGAQLQAKEEAQLKHKGALWKSRTQLVRQGRLLLQNGNYGEAAVCYEKYLKILKLVSSEGGKKSEELKPQDFNSHPKEITIICSVLWDLMLIYDSHQKFAQKQMQTAELLSKFLRFSPVYNTIIRKAEKEYRKGRNTQAYKHLLKLCDAQASRCFVANAAFETRTDPTVRTLCLFRDHILKGSPRGRNFVAFYYKNSGVLVALLYQFPQLKPVARVVLQGVARLVKAIFPLPAKRDS